jgi:hypothetical protein
VATHDYVIANGTGAAVRSDLNGALAAIVSQNSSASEPATMYAYMLWADTTAGIMKMRNGANSAWISLWELDGTFIATDISLSAGTAGAPSLYFTGDTNTGIYSPGADQVAISTGGSERFRFGASGQIGLAGANYGTSGQIITSNGSGSAPTWQTIASSQWTTTGSDIYYTTGNVGIGITPAKELHVYKASGTTTLWLESGDTQKAIAAISINNDSYAFQSTYNTGGSAPRPFVWNSVSSEQMRLDTSGRLLVGTSSTSSSLVTCLLQGNAAGSTSYAGLTLARGVVTPSDGDYLGEIDFSDNTHTASAIIRAQRDGGTWSGSSKPTRLTFSTTADGAASPTERMRIDSNGQTTATIGTSGGSYYVFSTVGNGTNCFRVKDNGQIYMGLASASPYNATTVAAANANLDSNGFFYRSTSSIKYKADVETLGDSYADAILDCRPVWYRSTTGNDNPEWGYWGFIAEEVAEIDPRLVSWKTHELQKHDDGTEDVIELETPEPEGVQYDRFVPHLLNLIKRQQQAIETLEAKVTALESQ